jgi:hypothetical protein
MARVTRPRLLSVVAALAVLTLAASCGGDSTGPKSGLSAAEEQQVTAAVFTEISTALAQSGGYSVSSIANGRLATTARLAQANATTTTISVSGDCSLGGHITSTMTSTDNIDDNGTGTGTVTGQFNILGCVVSTGTRNITVDGNPNIALELSMSFAQYELTQMSWKMNGGFKWNGGSCDLHYNTTLNGDFKGSGSYSVCGHSYSYSNADLKQRPRRLGGL